MCPLYGLRFTVLALYAYSAYNGSCRSPSIQKKKANLAKHGVSLTEGDDVLADPLALTMEDEAAEGEQRFISLGMNAVGLLRVAIWTARGEDVRIISVRKANRKETKIYEKAL